MITLSTRVKYIQQDIVREHVDCGCVSVTVAYATQVGAHRGRYASSQRRTLSMYLPLFLAENPGNTFDLQAFVGAVQSVARGRIIWQRGGIRADGREAMITQWTTSLATR